MFFAGGKSAGVGEVFRRIFVGVPGRHGALQNGLAHGAGPGADGGGILESHRGNAAGLVTGKAPGFNDASGIRGCGEQKEGQEHGFCVKLLASLTALL